MATKQPNILIIRGDDIGMWNVSKYSQGMMGYRTPKIDRIGEEGVTFTDWYGQQSCTAGRASFITGQNPIRTGLTKVGMPGATVGLQAEDATIAELLKPLGYATGQFGKNHLPCMPRRTLLPNAPLRTQTFLSNAAPGVNSVQNRRGFQEQKHVISHPSA